MNDFDQNSFAVNHLRNLPGECSIPSAGTIPFLFDCAALLTPASPPPWYEGHAVNGAGQNSVAPSLRSHARASTYRGQAAATSRQKRAE